jgi:hypothetical protein
MFVFASAHVRETAHGSKNKDEAGVHQVRAGFFPLIRSKDSLVPAQQPARKVRRKIIDFDP